MYKTTLKKTYQGFIFLHTSMEENKTSGFSTNGIYEKYMVWKVDGYGFFYTHYMNQSP